MSFLSQSYRWIFSRNPLTNLSEVIRRHDKGAEALCSYSMHFDKLSHGVACFLSTGGYLRVEGFMGKERSFAADDLQLCVSRTDAETSTTVNRDSLTLR